MYTYKRYFKKEVINGMHYLHDYSTFENTEELNKSVYLHIRNHTHELNETDRTALKMIARYAVKYAGAAHLKATTIADLIGKSEKTARRVVNKLAELGIIVKHYTFRKVNGGKGANIIVINPANENVREVVHKNVHKQSFDESTENSTSNPRDVQSTLSSREESGISTESKVGVRKVGKEPSYSINLSKTYLNTETLRPVPANALRSSIPNVIYDALAPFFNADEIYRYYGLLLKAKRKHAPNTFIEQDSEPYVETINAVVFNLKQGNVNKSKLDGYFYVSFARAASEVARRIAQKTSAEETKEAEENILSYDWLAG